MPAEIEKYLRAINNWDEASNYSLETANKDFLSYLVTAGNGGAISLPDIALPDIGDSGILSSPGDQFHIFW